MKPSFLLMWSRRLCKLPLFLTLCFLPLAQEGRSQCATGFLENWRLCATGSTLTEGTASVITLSVTRGLGVSGVSAEFTVGVPSSLATGASSGTVSISSSASTSTTASFIVQPANTNLYEGRRTFSLSARRTDSTESTSIAGLSGVINDDESPPSFTLSAHPTSWSESASSVSVSLTATLGSSIGKSLSVTFSASGTSNYSVSASQTRTISQGSTTASASLTFTPVNDNVDEPNSRITISARSNDPGIGTATTTVTQFDNDASESLSFSNRSVIVTEGSTAKYSVSLSVRPSASVTVSISHASGDSDISVTSPSGGSLTFTTGNWNVGQEVTLSAAEDDDIADGQATIRHTASGGGYTNITGDVTATEDDNDSPSLTFTPSSVTVTEGSTANYSVELSHEPTANVTVSVARFSGDSDISVTSPAGGSLTFTPGNWNVGQEVTLSAAQDNDVANGTATIRHTASGGGYASVTGDVTATERDDDRDISFTRTAVTVTEGGTAKYSVKLTGAPSGNVTLSITRASGDSDISVTSPAGDSLTFTTGNWNVNQEVTLSAAEDDDLADGQATIRHTASGGGYDSVTGDVTATEDDDDSPSLTFTPSAATVTEGGTGKYSVRLAYQPSADVTVAVAVVAGGDSDISVTSPAGGSLTFTTGNWNVGQEVTLSAAEDDDGLDGSATIRHTASGGGYASVTGDVTATEDDKDPLALRFSRNSFSVSEGDTANYSVSLATLPTANVTVSFALLAGSDADISISSPAVHSFTFTTGNWNVGQEVTLSAAEDLDGANGSATVRHTASGGGYASVTGDVTVTESDNDSPGFSFTRTTLSVSEGGTETYSLALATAPTASVTVNISRASGDSDISVTSPSGGSLTFTTLNWFVTQQVTLSADQDNDITDGQATIRHTASGGGYASVTGDVTATEDDDDSPSLTFTTSTVTVTEGGTGKYSVRLAYQPSADVRVAVAPVSGGDTDISVTSPSGGSLTFTTGNWNVNQEVTLSAAEDDDLADGQATIRHTASGGGYVSITGDVTATEDDNDSPSLTFTTSAVTVTEGSTARYSVRLAYQPSADVALVITRSSGDSDISVTSPAGGSLTFTTGNWNVNQEVTLSAAEDDDLADGQATIRHTALGGGYGSVTGDVTATEDDNDSPSLMFNPSAVTVMEGSTARYSVRLAQQPSANVTVAVAVVPGGDTDISVTSPSGGSLTFTAGNWNVNQEVTLSAAEDDDLADGQATIRHTASGGGYASVTGDVTATEDDNDSPRLTFTNLAIQVTEGSTAMYSVRLAHQPSATTTVTVAPVAGGDTDISVTSPAGGSLTFTTENWNVNQEVTLSAAEDDDLAAGRSLIRHTATGGGYDSVTGDVTATEDDNDSPSLTFTPSSVTVTEGSTAMYSIRLSHQPGASVAILLGRASGDTDLSASPAILPFLTTNWNVDQEVTITALQDDDLTNGQATIRHTALGGGYDSVTGDVTATEADDDSASLTFTTSAVTVTEGGTGKYSVRLAQQPSANVTVAVAVVARGDADISVTSPSGGSLTFTTGNWNVNQEVTLSAAEDDDLANGQATIRHTASGGGYASVTGDVTATEDDNDSPSLTFTTSAVTVTEGGTGKYSVRLAQQPSANVTVAVAVVARGDADISVTSPSGGSLTFTTGNWNVNQEVTLSAAEDDDLANGQATIRHTASGGGYGSVTGDVTATEDDNDSPSLVFTRDSLTVTEGGSAHYSVSLRYQPHASVAVSVLRTSGDTDLSPDPPLLLYTTTNWNIPKRVTVTAAQDDDGADGEATIRHTALGGGYDSVTGDVTATEDDDDSASLVFSNTSPSVPENDSVTYTLRLSTEPSATVTVAVAVVAGGDTDISVTSPAGGSLTFTTGNWNQPQDITLSAADDTDLEDGTATIRHTASGGGYDSVVEDITATETDDDSPRITLSEATPTVAEGGTLKYSVSLANQPSATVTVAVAVVAGGDLDISVTSPAGASLTFTTGNWSVTQEVTLSAAEDDDLADGQATIRHTASGGDYVGITADLVATEDDNDTGRLVFSDTAFTVPEGDTITYTLQLAFQPTGPVAVVVSRSSGDTDISPTPALVPFTTANWNVQQEVTLSAAEDDDNANGQAVIAHSALGGGYDSITGDVTATENDNDSPGFIFSRTSFSVPEGRNTTYTVRLSTKPAATVTVTASHTAGDTDISVTSPAGGSLTFTTGNWNVDQQVTLAAAEDLDAANGQATISHTASGGGYDSVTGDLTITESDNDAPGFTLSENELAVPEGSQAVYTLALATAPTATVTVGISRASGDSDISVTSPSGGSLTFTTGNWDQPQEITLSAAEDDDGLPGEARFTHTAVGGGYDSTAADLVATETDNDTLALVITGDPLPVEEGSTAAWTVHLATRPSADVRIGISRSSGDTDLSAVSSLLSFTTATWDQPQDVEIQAAEDDDGDNGEALFLHTASGADYAGITAEATAVEVDNDSAGFMLSDLELEIDENGASKTYTLSLVTAPTGPVTVSIVSRDATIATPPAPTLAFTTIDWNQPKPITINAIDDSIDSDRTVVIDHTASGGGYDSVTAELTITLIDDDTAGVMVRPEELQIEEPGEATYTVQLTSEPTSPVVIAISRLGDNVDNLDWDPKRLTFSEVDWDDPQEVRLRVAQDEDDLPGVALMRHTATSSDAVYSGIGIDDVEIVVGDDDQEVTAVTLTLDDDDIAEGEPSALITVTATLDAITTTELSVALSLGGTATSQDYSVGGVQPITIDAGEIAGQTVLTFAPIDDALVEGDETIIINGASQGLTVTEAVLTIIDDDADIEDAVGGLSVDIDRVAESARDTLVTVTLTLEDGFTFDELRSFDIGVRGTGAAAAVDFAPIEPFALTLLSNVSTASGTFVLRPENDFVDEIDETLTISAIASPVTIAPATIILVDDDAPPPGISLSLDDPDIAEGDPTTDITVTATVDGATTFAQAVTVALSLGGTATEGEDRDYTVRGGRSITIPAGDRSGTAILMFTPIDDTRDELDELIDITGTTTRGVPVTPTTLTLLDNDESLLTLRANPRRLTEGDAPTTVTLTVTVRNGIPYDEALTIDLDFGGTAIRATDYTVAGRFSFTLPAGQVTASTAVTVTPIDDSLDEPDETLEIVGQAGVGFTSTAVIVLADNDIPPARIHLTVTPTQILETAPPTRFVLLARVEGSTAFSTDTEIALDLAGTATSTVDYDLGGIAAPLVIPAGSLTASRELNLSPIDDPHPEGLETILITGQTVVRVVSAEIALVDDDGETLTITFTRTLYTANEYGSPAAVSLTITPAADRRETLSLSITHLGTATPDDYRGVPPDIAIQPGDSTVAFTVEALPDEVYETGESIRLTLDTPSAKINLRPHSTATVRFIEQRSTETFSGQARTVLALSSRAWSDSVQSALEERFARARQTEEWGGWQPDYEEPPPASEEKRSPALLPQSADHADRLIPGDWLTAWRQKNERRNMGLVEPRLSLRKVLARLKGWRPVLWAEGATHHFSGRAQALDYQGAFQAAHVGLDLHSGKKTLIGASLMRGRSAMDYSDGQALDGSTAATLYTIHPYIHFEAHDRVTVWTIGGLGFAPLSLQELDRDHDLSGSARMAAGGIRIQARSWQDLELAIRSDGDIAWIGAKLPAESVTLGGHAGRLRLLAELTQSFRVFGQDLIAAGEAGGRLDRGGGHRGAGAEAGGRISWRKPRTGLDLSVHGNSLLWHQSGFRIWGAGIQASWDPGAEKRGLVLRFASGRGPRGGKTRLFQEAIDRLLQPADTLDSEFELGYGTGVQSRLLTLTFRLQGLSGWTAAIDLR